MNAKATTVRAKVNASRLLQNSRYAFTNNGTLLIELMQNARRAGASRVDIETPDANTVVVVDDGHGIADMQDILHVAQSGWNEEIMESDSPYGLGCLSMFYFSEHVTIESGAHRISTPTSKVLALEDVPVEDLTEPLKGTRITLKGGQIADIIKAANFANDGQSQSVYKAAKGYPLPVYYNGVELKRPHAIDTSFEAFDVGFIRVEWDRLSFNRPLTDADLFLQGIEIRNDRLARDTGITVHLDPTWFKGRMPDRDVLVAPLAFDRIIRDAILVYLRAGLEAFKRSMTGPSFVMRWGDICLNSEPLRDLLNDVEWVPAHWFHDKEAYLKFGRNDDLSTEQGPRSRAQLEQRGVVVIETIGDEDVLAMRFALASSFEPVDASVLNRLDPGHWLKSLARQVRTDEFSIDIVNERGRASGFVWDRNVTVVACEGFTLRHPQLGTIEIADRDAVGVYTGRSEYRPVTADYPLPSYEMDLLVMTGGNSDVLEQYTDFKDENESYDDHGEREARSALDSLYAQAAGQGPADIFGILLRGKDLGYVEAAPLMGASFTVTYDEKGFLKSVEMA